jgi:hypothetical protein
LRSTAYIAAEARSQIFKAVAMSQLVDFPLDGGGSILVQSAVSGDDNVVTRGWREEQAQGTPERARETFEAAVAKIRPAADSLLSTLSGLAHSPSEVTIEFAVELSAKAGAYIATLGSTANFKVTLTWRADAGADAPARR